MSKKTIIHQKYDKKTITYEELARSHNMIKNALPEDYILITTPTEISKIEGDDLIVTIDAKKYSTNELLDIIEKAWQYDELNK